MSASPVMALWKPPSLSPSPVESAVRVRSRAMVANESGQRTAAAASSNSFAGTAFAPSSPLGSLCPLIRAQAQAAGRPDHRDRQPVGNPFRCGDHSPSPGRCKANPRQERARAEQRNGKAADVSFELLSKGHKLALNMGGILKAVIIGDKVKDIAKETFKYGISEALVIEHPDLLAYKTMPYSRIMNKLVNEAKPRIVLFGATIIGRDLAPRVASNTKSGLTADCTDLKIASIKYLGKEFKDL